MKEILTKNGLLLTGKCDLNALTYEVPVLVWGGVRAHDVKLGAYSYISPNTLITNAKVGRYSCIGHACEIGLSKHCVSDVIISNLSPFRGISTKGLSKNAYLGYKIDDENPSLTNIANDVWIGAHSIIPAAHEINIANGAIVAAGSVVAKDVPAFAIVAGNPAKVVKMRFSDEVCADLNETKWWDYDWQEAAAALPDILSIAPIKDAKAFCAWWRQGGAELLAPFAISPITKRLRKDESGVFLDTLGE